MDSTSIVAVGAPIAPTAPLSRAQDTGISSDDHLVDVWLRRLSMATQESYRRDLARFRRFVAKPLGAVTVPDLVDYTDTLCDYADTSRVRMLASVKSCLTFAQKIGYIRFNVGPGCETPRAEDKLSERILSKLQVHQMIACEPDPRNMAILLFLYASGARVSEACRLRWRNAVERIDGGQVTLFGKGRKTRAVLLSADTWRALLACRGDAGPHDPVFRSANGGCLCRKQVWHIVHNAGIRARIDRDVFPHMLRHSHATHALEGGCPPHIVQATLGHSSLQVTSRYTHARPEDSSARYLSI